MKKARFIAIYFLGIIALFAQETITNTTICWDISSSMMERDLEKDFSVLEKVFQRNGNQEVQLLLFNLEVEERSYTIKDGNWNQLKQDLQNAKYDGGTIYASLKGKIKYPNVYVFTDGRKTLSKDVLTLEGKSFLINSNPHRDAKFLERTALLNRSRLMDYATMLPENVVKLQKQKSAEGEAPTRQLLKGTVFIDNKPTSNVKVAVQGISDSFLTGPQGSFSIAAQVGDTLVVTSRDSKTVKVVPVEAMAHTNVFLDANIVSLDEVVVVEQQLEEEMAITGFGLQDKKTLGYTVSEIGGEDISAVQTNVSETINTKVSGLTLGKTHGNLSQTGIERAEIRGRNTINMNPYALVVVNGVPTDRTSREFDKSNGSWNGAPNSLGGNTANRNANFSFIDPSNIAKITVLKGLAATNAYGSEGANGVILITTKTAVAGVGTQEKRDLALVQNNVYDEDESKLVARTNSDFVGFVKGTTVEKAYETYLSAKAANQENIKFYVAAFDFFKDKDAEIAKDAISNILEHSEENTANLRVVSSALASIGDYENAIRINEEIIIRSPNDVNAYYDKAVAKRELGKYQEALNELMALAKGNTYFSVNAANISKTLDREIKNLVFKHKGQLNTANIDAKYLNNLRYKVRLVFEWNEPAEEFELQFVNPQKRFFNWVHTNTEIKARIEDEIKNNYRVEEYEFYGDVAGEWVINAKYLGETKKENETPFVLKCTIFKDFGYPTQAREEVMISFSRIDEKRNIKNLFVN